MDKDLMMGELLINVLVDYKKIKTHNLLSYSQNIAGTIPKEGFEKEHSEANKDLNKINILIGYYSLI